MKLSLRSLFKPDPEGLLSVYPYGLACWVVLLFAIFYLGGPLDVVLLMSIPVALMFVDFFVLRHRLRKK